MKIRDKLPKATISNYNLHRTLNTRSGIERRNNSKREDMMEQLLTTLKELFRKVKNAVKIFQNQEVSNIYG